MIEVRRSAARYETRQPGILTRHSLSSGAHYDPANVAFGSLIAFDEHLLDPGAGFDWHPHRGVDIVSWVLDGELSHEDDAGHVERIGPGTLQYQRAGTGISHRELNTSPRRPLRFVQVWLLSAAPVGAPRYESVAVPRHGYALRVSGGAVLRVVRLDGSRDVSAAPYTHLFVARGSADADGIGSLRPGDAARARHQLLTLRGRGELLIVTMPA